ncbi:MAG: hypothetical protein HYZ14_04150 [Bacteroidetes bacterium]|nr:hypothetical protein [Bacteroidota bacterium]
MRKILFTLLVSAGTTTGFAQHNISAEFVGFTIHPAGDPTAPLQPNKLDKDARFVVNYGAVITYEHYLVGDVVALKGLQAIAADCSAGWASITHVALKGLVLRQPKHRLGVSVGPAFMVRESWFRFESYVPSGFLNEGYSKFLGPVQYKFFPLAAEIEYEYSLTPKIDFELSLTPGLPMAITFAAGFKYWFNKDFEHKLYLPKIN